MTPYYERDGVTLFCADWRKAKIDVSTIALAYCDGPYGVNEQTNRKSKGRAALTECNDFPFVFGDNEPFDPTPCLGFKRVVLWGANHFANRLPNESCWLTWDKRDGGTSDDNADCEHAWTNFGGSARLFRHKWRGMIKASEQEERRIHPTQKPVALAQWVFGLARVRPGDLVLIPYAGSGSEIVAARNLGLRVLAFEIESQYCECIVARLSQAVLPLAVAERDMEQVDMFATETA